MTESRNYTVEGMSCAHCELAVRDEVSAIAGVRALEVDLPSGRLTVQGDVADADVRAAVHEAGYHLAA